MHILPLVRRRDGNRRYKKQLEIDTRAHEASFTSHDLVFLIEHNQRRFIVINRLSTNAVLTAFFIITATTSQSTAAATTAVRTEPSFAVVFVEFVE